MSYITILIIVLVSGVSIEWFFKEHLFHSLRGRIICAVIALASIAIWDLYAIPRGHWVFTGQGILGIFIGPIPIEEFLWALWVPYLWVTIYKAAHIISDKKRKGR
ncbi:MAG: lycopene cyclase domain-containing protein [Candidatus Colwellbacteria bacterium]|nr:lycopene cyclase domain-containing protein [Candidatus Colwellbacteria bacterium]